jgi:hypothetical protein
LDIPFCGDVFCECSVFVVYYISTVAESTDAVSFLEVLGNFASDFFDDTGVVAA